ncbi:MAG: hypothetical protein IKS01_05220 [Paludibacteraceae bacterium]|nr:hypothetical protein [Paludibacteraceae bacterium]
MSTTDLDTLVINYLTQAQYESAKSGGTIDPDQIYLTPAQGTGVTDVEVDGSSVVTGGVAEVDLSGKADVSHTHTKSQITDFPTIPTITDTYSGTSSDGMSGKAVKSAIDALDGTISGSAGAGKTLTAFSQTDGKVSATFSNISITKSQVSDFPTIPTVNNATLTIQRNGTTVKTFTANASSNVTANITVPTDTGDLTNGAGYITGYTETDPTVPSWAKASSKPSYTFSEIGSKPSTLSGYGITDAKIESGTITLGSNTITPLTSFTETDPVFSASASSGITSTDISNWNNGKLSLDTSAQAGTTDGDLYAAIVALGWASDVIE